MHLLGLRNNVYDCIFVICVNQKRSKRWVVHQARNPAEQPDVDSTFIFRANEEQDEPHGLTVQRIVINQILRDGEGHQRIRNSSRLRMGERQPLTHASRHNLLSGEHICPELFNIPHFRRAAQQIYDFVDRVLFGPRIQPHANAFRGEQARYGERVGENHSAFRWEK